MRYEKPEELVRDWAEAALKEPDTGLPAVPVKLDLDWPLGRLGVLLGPYEGDEETKSGTRFLPVDLRFSFTSGTSEELVAAIAEDLATAVEEDPSLDGWLGTGRLRYKDAKIEPDAGSYGDESTLLTVSLGLSTVE